MIAEYHSTRRVEFADTDAAGIAHFTAFFAWMEETEHEFLRSRGLSVIVHDQPERPLSWPRVGVSCDFTSAVRFEDVLDIRLSILRLGAKSISYGFEFSCEGRAVAEGRITAVCCRMSSSGPPESVPIPDWFIEKLGGSPR
ncbi:MAG: acyl-CoA thioesterase [Planctomycetes bacterium]|nr:acyl-CoA thioesterase [Planctomycetota bacterium]